MNALNARTQTLPYKYFLTLSWQIFEIDEFTTCEQLAGQIDQDKGATDGVPGDGEFEEDKEEGVHEHSVLVSRSSYWTFSMEVLGLMFTRAFL